MTPSCQAIFLDRDGTLVIDVGYAARCDQLTLLPGVVNGLQRLQAAGLALLVASNQSGVARGLFTLHQAGKLMTCLRSMLAKQGITLLDIAFCPHGQDDGCSCRKPAPGLLIELARRHDIDLARSFMVGDRERDVAAGVAAGCQGILIGQPGPDGTRAAAVAQDFAGAVDAILALVSGAGRGLLCPIIPHQ